MTASKHPTLPELIEWRRGRAEAAAADAVQAHIARGCAFCERALRQADRMLAAAAEGLADPPGAAVSRARALFAATRKEPLSKRLREFVAGLLPGPAPALAATRDAFAGLETPAVFSAGPWLVEVRSERRPPRRRTLRLRVVASADGHPGSGLVQVLAGGKLVREELVDDLGEAVLDELPAARAELCLLLGGDCVYLGV